MSKPVFLSVKKMLALLFLPFAASILLLPTAAWAHRVNLFAWLEGDKVIVKCGFNRSTPVKGGKITVVDSIDGKLLAKGLTSDEGTYVFRVPDVVRLGHGLRISVNAGEGHASEFEMSASEFYEGAALEAGFETARLDAATLNPENSAPSRPVAALVGSPQPSNGALSAEDVRKVVDKTLQKHLAPIHNALGTGAGIGLGNILAGLGWIMGIAGIICYFRARRGK